MRPITADRSCKSLCTEKEPRGSIANTRGWKGMSPASIHPLGQVVAALERHCHLIRGHALELGEILGILPLEEFDTILCVCLATEMAVRRSLLVLGLPEYQRLRDGVRELDQGTLAEAALHHRLGHPH